MIAKVLVEISFSACIEGIIDENTKVSSIEVL